MATIDAHSVSSDKRAVGLRTRTDLVVKKSVYQGEYCWIIKDPLAMKYFRLRAAEHLVLEALREQVSYRELKQLLCDEFPEQVVNMEVIQRLVSQLHQSGLLISQSSGQATPLGKRRVREKQQKLMRLAMSIYALKFPGWDPEQFLNWLYPKCRFLFSSWFTILVLATCLGALTLVGVNFQAFQAKLPEFSQFFAAENLLLMFGLLIFTKSIHELGHGLMCKHFGGECHQIGFMLMVLTPAMYCDTSDSWTLRNRWHRIAIGAGGMYVEVFLAALCTFVWWFTNPGWIHYIALNIMFLSSVTTLLFNANPLLRYDGYYILSDFWEIPNLAQKARLVLLSKLRTWGLGMKPIPSNLLPRKDLNWVAVYGLTSFAYRMLVLFGIAWFINEVLKPHGLQAFAHLFIAMSLTGILIVPLIKLFQFFSFPGRLREVKPKRFWASAAILGALVLFVGYFPLPHYIWADFVVRPPNAQNLVLAHEGQLRKVNFRAGDYVEQGQTIATLENSELILQLEEMKGRLARLESDRLGYEFLSASELESARKLAETVAEIRGVKRQLAILQRKVDNLQIVATQSGQLFAPDNVSREYHPDSQLQSWQDTPLASENLGVFLESNTLLGSLGNPTEMEIMLTVAESDVEYLAPGQSVTALMNAFSNVFVQGQLTGIAEDELKYVPRELSQSNQGPIAVEPDVDGNEQPILKFYEAYVVVDSSELKAKDVRLLPGAIGKARIEVGSKSLGGRLLRYVQTVLNFR